jgi:glycosyltransferase involved in cell wall biosynthesis
MPVYNAENYLRAALDSVLNQTLRDIELICVEDGSTDGSLAILEEYAARDGRVTVLRHAENQGTLVARKHCMQAARGQYVMWLDPDDTLTPDACETVWNEMRRSPADVLQFGTEVLAEEPESPQTKKLKQLLEPCCRTVSGERNDLIRACYIEHKWNWGLWNKAFPRALCEAALPFVEERRVNNGEDEYISFLLLYFARSYRGIRKKLYRYMFGSGVTAGGSISLKRFASLSTRAEIYAALQRFLQQQKAPDPARLAVLNAMRTQATEDMVWQWMQCVPIGEACAAYDTMLRGWGAVPVVSALARLFWEKEDDILQRIAPENAPAWRNAPRPVKHLAVYYVSYANGGVERVLSILLPLWMEMGYRVTFVTDEPPCAQDHPLPAGVERVVLPHKDAAEADNYAPRAEAWQRLIERYEIDTVVYHAWNSPTLLWDTCVAKGLGCNFILESHGAFSMLFYELERQPLHAARAAQVYTMRLVDALVALSRTYTEFWQNFCPAYYIPNPTVLPPKSECAAPEKEELLWVGRLSYEKRPEDALRAMQRIAAACPDAHLTIVGAGNNEKQNRAMQAMVEKLRLQDKVTLAGYHADVAPYYRRASVLLMTSMFEGFPMVLAEAKSYGVPVVLYDLPYLEMVRDARGVVTVPQEDADALADAAIRLLRDENARREAARQARAGAEAFAAIDLRAAWQKVFDDVGDGTAARPQAPTEEQRMVALWMSGAYGKTKQERKQEARRRKLVRIGRKAKKKCKKMLRAVLKR